MLPLTCCYADLLRSGRAPSAAKDQAPLQPSSRLTGCDPSGLVGEAFSTRSRSPVGCLGSRTLSRDGSLLVVGVVAVAVTLPPSDLHD